MCYKLPGPRCSRHAKIALQKAQASNDQEAIREAKIAFATTPKGIDILKRQGKLEEAEKYQKRRDRMIAAYTETLTIEQLKHEVEERINNPDFDKLIEERDAARERYNNLSETYFAERHGYDPDELQQKTEEIKEAYFANLEAKDHLEEYKDETAQIVGKMSEGMGLEVEEYTGETLNNLVHLEEHPSNSRPWLKLRQGGIGGSDVGAILKVDKKWGKKNYDKILESKTVDYDAMDDSEFTPTSENEGGSVHGATERGDVWEPVIVSIFANKNPEYKVMHSKMTWVDKDDDEIRVNVDGLLSDREDGEPNGILEIKTASDAEDWANGVPLGYRAQVLYYLHATNFDYGHVAVKIDDKEYRQYRINRGEKISEEVGSIEDNWDELKKFMDKAKKRRSGETKKRSYTRNPHPPIKEEKNPNADAALLIANYSGRDVEEVRKSIQARGGDVDYDKAVREEFANSKLADKDYVMLDLETTGAGIYNSEIIEVGWTRRNKKNEVLSEGSLLFSPDERYLKSKGTGMEEVHHIKPEDVSGKPHFSDPEAQKQMLEAFDGATLVPHNASFEKSFLNQNLKGFRERNYPFVDTMYLAKYFDPETPNNKLESFAENNGVKYENAHRALQDANMTADALFNFAKKNNHL